VDLSLILGDGGEHLADEAAGRIVRVILDDLLLSGGRGEHPAALAGDLIEQALLHTAIGGVPPAEHEAAYYAQNPAPAGGWTQQLKSPRNPGRFTAAVSKQPW
jgi:hypothetical protein